MSIDLTAKQGPLKGERFSVNEELLIGRSARGVNLPDPTVSLRHAVIKATRAGFAITDLGSATGTMVNGRTLEANRPRTLETGDEIGVGESVFLVGSSRERILKVIFFSMIPAWLLVAFAVALVFVVTGEPSTTLGLSSPVRTNEGPVTSLTFPRSFLRRYGIAVRELGLRQITDLDENGVDEIWVHLAQRELVITFGSGGEWKLLADLPHGCHVPDDGQRDIQCGNIQYRLMGEMYEPVAHTQPVIWLKGAITIDATDPPVETVEPEAPGVASLNAGKIVPFRVAPGFRDRLAGFLAERGVVESVHYILCEEVVEGLPAQALTASKEAIPLGFGCSDVLTFGGPRGDQYQGARIAAVALSATGAEHLADNISYSLSGFEGDLFLEGENAKLVQQLRANPIDTRGGLSLVSTSTPHVFDPIAAGLLPPRVGLYSTFERPPDVIAAKVTHSGDAILKAGACAKLQVHTVSFRCALLRGCTPLNSFVRVRDIGCEEEPVYIVDSGYQTGVWVGRSDHTEVRIQIESQGTILMRDVLMAQVAARPILPEP